MREECDRYSYQVLNFANCDTLPATSVPRHHLKLFVAATLRTRTPQMTFAPTAHGPAVPHVTTRIRLSAPATRPCLLSLPPQRDSGKIRSTTTERGGKCRKNKKKIPTCGLSLLVVSIADEIYSIMSAEKISIEKRISITRIEYFFIG